MCVCIPFMIKLVDILDEIDPICMYTLRENEEKKSYCERKRNEN
jgi:hypothetical protein